MSFDGEELEMMKVIEDEIHNMISPVVLGMTGVSFQPYNGMAVKSYRDNELTDATIVSHGRHGAMLRWDGDDINTCSNEIPYSLIEPDCTENFPGHINFVPDLIMANNGQWFLPYEGQVVLVVGLDNMNHPAKISGFQDDRVQVKFSDSGNTETYDYKRILPVMAI